MNKYAVRLKRIREFVHLYSTTPQTRSHCSIDAFKAGIDLLQIMQKCTDHGCHGYSATVWCVGRAHLRKRTRNWTHQDRTHQVAYSVTQEVNSSPYTISWWKSRDDCRRKFRFYLSFYFMQNILVFLSTIMYVNLVLVSVFGHWRSLD